MATKHEVRQERNIVRDNPFGLPQATASKVVEMLNADLASMFTLYHQYHKHHWIVEGSQFLELHLLLEAHYTELHDQFDVVAERIVALGGLPVTGPTQIEKHAYVKHEPEGMFNLREMLEHDVDIECTLSETMREHIAAAAKLGDFGTETLIKRHLRAQELRTQDLMHMLEHETLDEQLAGKQ